MKIEENMELPVILVTSGVLLPGASLKIPIRSKLNIQTIEKYLTRSSNDNYVVIAYKVSTDKVYEVATIAYVEKLFGWTFNSTVHYSLDVIGLHRANIDKLSLPTCIVSKVVDLNEAISNQNAIEKLVTGAKIIASNSLTDKFSREIYSLIDEKEYGKLADLCVSQMKFLGFMQLLEFLGANGTDARVEMCIKWMNEKKDANTLKLKVPNSLEASFPVDGKKRKIPNVKNQVEQLEEKLNAIEFSDEVSDRVYSELHRLKSMNAQQSEYNILMNWLELVSSLPWNTSTIDDIELHKARTILTESHEAMDDVKERVLEHLAVCKMNNSVKGMILCFTGPPGIGKTSIAKAIAESMGRKFQRVSLGGIRDESDIRGHRRTYVAAMPGRIIEALKTCKTNNPVFLLDEVDKLYSGNQGSPSAALLELLDPEQNSTFHDHYLNIPFDVSKIMFIATANDIDRLEPALRDRLEIIEMSGYSLKEKVKICENHLLTRQLTKHCISHDYVKLERQAIVAMIEEYTMEAGVRQLERNVGAICRNVALRLAEALNSDPGADVLPVMELPIQISASNIHKILKNKHMKRVKIVEKMRPLPAGVCFGLSVTTIGGRVMPIEASKSKGTGKIVTTGHLGKVLKESILVAKGWLSANSERLGLGTLEDQDIHVHLPAGAVNKDGPSAGTGLACALVSLATNIPLRSDAAVTGEISLTGHVLPIGGVKEKVLAAQREGLRRVVLPKSNEEEYLKMDEDIRLEMDVVLAETIEDVIGAMMDKSPVLAKL
ncbi:Lon protease homolog 2, peroxisomal [Caenorhabditis elegans]|uniref:Lon protease homolog 2, peroxisomal n=1 Tax=Caenorhabditis elegans TaxID=6239 RepID=LONP2_CAEEL|nr:Lon protease homolog 2, peroxisomal [Caenorhabditis elegans]Q9XW87.1 RecName: Full=Lon protease homolog 2, peroxisomal [Caenorhabditis elegans]CAA22082.1 Lon protease homolog 2, peroxisomal [Caenorhabditis elegans]|eukprot:NP_499577.1 Lon protease homolog 2, peroxisomal [Caenorhabditis elegans]